MKCNEIDKKVSRQKNYSNLDRALHELGMLSTVTEARHEFLREAKSECCMMRLNSRYVSNLTVGYCMRRTTTRARLCPYLLPLRHRTKSENSDHAKEDVSDNLDLKCSLLEPSTSGHVPKDTNVPVTKRCHSLENLNLSSEHVSVPDDSIELDCVSNQIQKLQVD